MLSWGNETLKIPSLPSPPPPLTLSRRSSGIDIEYTPLQRCSSCRSCLLFKWRYHKYHSMWIRCSQSVSTVLPLPEVLRKCQLIFPKALKLVTAHTCSSGLTPETLPRTRSSTFQVSKAEYQTMKQIFVLRSVRGSRFSGVWSRVL